MAMFDRPAEEMSDEELAAALEEVNRGRRERINEKAAKKRRSSVQGKLRRLPAEELMRLTKMMEEREKNGGAAGVGAVEGVQQQEKIGNEEENNNGSQEGSKSE